MTLYESLIHNISNALYNTLNEKTVVRTIDNKLWLSVASTCSRNRSTEAEFIKPIGTDKNLLLLRYVAALIIMKKPCPDTVQDIDNIKTFKLVGKRALELGTTIEDIKKLYTENTGTNLQLLPNTNTLIDNNKEEPSVKQTELIPERKKSIFDEVFDDEEDEDEIYNVLAGNLLPMYKDSPLSPILAKLLGIDKPRGWKFYKNTNTDFEYYELKDRDPSYLQGNKKYLKDIIRLVKSKGWKKYEIGRYFMNSICGKINYENISESDVIHNINVYVEYNVNPKDWETEKERSIKEYYEIMKNRKRFINALPDNKIKKLFEADDRLTCVYISPDNGVMLKYLRDDQSKLISVFYQNYKYVLTFTGFTNYNDDLSNNDFNKQIILDVKEQQKINKIKLKVFDAIIKRSGLQHIKWNKIIDFDGYPVLLTYGSKKYAEERSTTFIKNYAKKKDTMPKYLYIEDTNKQFNDSLYEYIQNKKVYDRIRFKLIARPDTYHKYSKTGDYYVMLFLTDDGKEDFDALYK